MSANKVQVTPSWTPGCPTLPGCYAVTIELPNGVRTTDGVTVVSDAKCFAWSEGGGGHLHNGARIVAYIPLPKAYTGK